MAALDGRRVSRRCATLLLAVGLAASVGASADTSNDRRPGTLVYAIPGSRGGITLEAGGADNQISISTDAASQTTTITDTANAQVDMRPGPRQYAELCDQVTRKRVRCDLFTPVDIRALTRAGDDSIVVNSTELGLVDIRTLDGADSIDINHPRGARPARVQLDDGPDSVTAGESGDVVHGGRGHDTLRGEAGDDRLDGGRGEDEIYAGSGADVIDARSGDTDRRIECGSGEDSAVVDRGLDPFPQACEHVTAR